MHFIPELQTEMASHNDLGHIGECKAAAFLQQKGYSILHRNWKYGDLEVDIIALDRDEIVFVEVKTRSTYQWGNPEQAVGELRKRRLTAAANIYLKVNKLDNPFRFDIISIVMNPNEQNIDHIENAFALRPHYYGAKSMLPESKWSKSYWKKRK